MLSDDGPPTNTHTHTPKIINSSLAFLDFRRFCLHFSGKIFCDAFYAPAPAALSVSLSLSLSFFLPPPTNWQLFLALAPTKNIQNKVE